MDMINKKEDKLVFSLNISETLANGIRRSVGKIPVLAVDEIEISKNGSALFDETIAHRIGLTPLKMEKKFEKSLPKLKLKTKKEGLIYSEELEGGARVTYGKIPLASLTKGQEIELSAITKIGTGVEHSKFNPGLIYYRNSSKITVEKALAEEVKKVFPGVEIKEKGNAVVISDKGEKEIRDLVEGLAERFKSKVETTFGDDLILGVESFGQIPVAEVFTGAISQLKNDLNDFQKSLK